MAANPLTRDERDEIRNGIAVMRTIRQISDDIGRSEGCVSNEINRNGGRARYNAAGAQRRCDSNLQRPKATKFESDPRLAREVTARIRRRDSPMTISIELRSVGLEISHETIYQAVYRRGRGLPVELHGFLHLQHRTRRRQRRHRRNPSVHHSLGVFASIHDRPQAASGRDQGGHIEGDLIVGASNRSAMITLADRQSRLLWLCRLDTGKQANGVEEALVRTLRRIPNLETLTWDQGSEMANHQSIAERAGVDIYFADPKSPWQRPSNENINALVRRYVGRGDLSVFTTRQLRRIERRINSMPRRIHNWESAETIYHADLTVTG